MSSISSSRCLTRIVAGDDMSLEVAQIQTVMTRIQTALRGIPDAQRDYVANALLNLAVARLVKEEGGTRTASLLIRLGDVIATQSDAPPAQRAIDLSRTDA